MKNGLNEAIKLISTCQRYELTWDGVEERSDGIYILYDEIKDKIIEMLQEKENEKN